MKYVEDDHDKFYFKSSRNLLSVGNNKIIELNSGIYQTDKPWFWFILIVSAVLFFLLLVKCCVRLSNIEDEETSRLTLHPPPRTVGRSRIQPSNLPYTNSPQTTSRSLILSPEPGTSHDVFFAIENPNFNLFTINLHPGEGSIPPQSNTAPNDPFPSNQLPSNSSLCNKSTLLQDLPPAYDSVVTANQQNTNNATYFINRSNNLQNSERLPPPKYEDLH